MSWNSTDCLREVQREEIMDDNKVQSINSPSVDDRFIQGESEIV